MEFTSPRFETTLPKEHFYAPGPKPIKPASSADWRTLGIVGIVAVTFIATVNTLHHPAPVVAPPAPLAAPPVPTPEVRRAQLVAPEVRRAQFVAAPIGMPYWTKMPDGSDMMVRYMGRAADFAALPRNPQLGDMWGVAGSGASWVWCVPTGFTRPAWVDP